MSHITNLFCPGCGSTKGPFFKGLCRHCFLERHCLVELPSKLTVARCRVCGKVRLSGNWVEQSKASFGGFLERKAKVKDLSNALLSIEFVKPVSFKPSETAVFAVIKARGTIEGKVIEGKAETTLCFAKTMCPDCLKLSSQRFEATIQLRFGEKSSDSEKQQWLCEVIKAISVAGDRSITSTVSIAHKDKGFDLQLSSNKVAEKAVKRLSVKCAQRVKRSFKVVGRNERGKPRKRFTYCLRF